MAKKLAFVVLVICTAVNNAFGDNPLVHFDEFLNGLSLDFLKKFIQLITSKKALMQPIEGFLISELVKHTGNLSATCQEDIKYTLNELMTHTKFDETVLESWPLKMLDSFGKPEGGLLAGNRYWMGNFYQCLDIEVKYNSSSKVHFVGEYCLVKLVSNISLPHKVPFNISFYIGTCFPSSCNLVDKEKLVNIFTAPLRHHKILSSVNLTAESCTIKEPATFDAITQFLIAIICIPALLVCLATIADYLWNYTSDEINDHRKRGISTELLLSFSAIRSVKTVFHSNEINSSLSAMHGIRVISMFWVIIGHIALACTTDYPWHNQLQVLKMFKNFLLQPFSIDAMLSVTTFFTLSGFLVAYLFMQQIRQREGWLMFIGFYAYRYIRLTPAYALVLAILTGPADLIGEGPLWKKQILNQRTICRQSWWKNLLYVNSWYTLSTECYPVSWYLSTDTMLYIIAPIFLYPLSIKPMVALFLAALFSIAATVATLILIVTRGYVTYIGADIERSADFFTFANEIYIKPWYNFTPYAIGLIAGYFLFICEERKIKFTKNVVLPGWILSLLIISVTVYGKFPYFSGEKQMGPFLYAIYGTFSRPGWALAVSWTIFACAIGSGGLINSFLSLGIFIPMSRLTYSAYLVHLLVLTYYFSVQKHSVEFTFYNVIVITIANVAFTMTAALILAVLAELPILEMMKQLARWYYSSASSSRALIKPLWRYNFKKPSLDKGQLSLLPQTITPSPESSDTEFSAHS